jgi:hypothetical protein
MHIAAKISAAIVIAAGAAVAAQQSIEQTNMGTKVGLEVVASFDGLGVGFNGPQGTTSLRNPSDNSLAVGPDHIVQVVNGAMAIYTKKGKKYNETGRVLYGPVQSNISLFKGQGGQCESRRNGDVVVRYDQIANRWLFVSPLFQRGPNRPDQPAIPKGGEPAQFQVPAVANQPGPAAPLFVPPTPAAAPANPPANPAPAAPANPRTGAPGPGGRGNAPPATGPYGMCYAVSTTSDPMGSYYRYEFLRALFPDYPRPAIWTDGYYIPTSTGDNRISETIATQKHACVVERDKMLAGKPAREQCLIIENVNFLNNADIDGKNLPPKGSPNIMIAAGGEQLSSKFEDDGLYAWQFKVDWDDPSKTTATGPQKISVAPYHYLCNGQLTDCVPQPGTDHRLDAQGDKIMARVAYRNVHGKELIVLVHSVNTASPGGGVRWYELDVDAKSSSRALTLKQQGTYAPGGSYRWMGSPAIDKNGNIGIGYSFGGAPNFAGQRFAGRLANDPLNQLTLREVVLAEGAGSQTTSRNTTERWEDYTQTGVDPSDDCTIWYVGDYFKKDATAYSTRIAGVRLPGCR